MIDIEAMRQTKFAEVLYDLNKKAKAERSLMAKTRLVGLRYVVGSMCVEELEWWQKTYNFLTPVLSHISPSSSLP